MKDVEIFIITGAILTLLFVVFIVSFLLANQKRHFGYLKEKEDQKKRFEEILLRSQLEIREQTLQHLSYELHDNIGQVASLIKIYLNTLVVEDAQAKSRIEETKDLVRQMISDLKSLSLSFNSERVSHMGLSKALEFEVDRLNRIGHFAATIELGGVDPILDPSAVTIIFRMAQEAINNAVKHSGASKVDISLKGTEKMIILSIRDDGVGFDRNGIIAKGGSGLNNLESRAKLIGARLELRSSHGNGTEIQIELPV